MAKAVKLKNSLYLASTSIVHKRGGGWYYLNNLLDNIYPIGSIFISTVNTNPSTYFGGTWERIKGRFLLAADDSTYTLGATGGAATHTLTIDEIPSHTHKIKRNDNYSNGFMIDTGRIGQWGSAIIQVGSGNYTAQPRSITVENSGGGKAHNNMPPYLVVYVWKRVS